MEYITPTDWKFDIGRLQDEVNHLLQHLSFDTHHIKNQLSVTSRPNSPIPIYDGVGSLWHRDNQCYIAKECEFTEVNEEFRGTYLEHIYDTIRATTPLGRVRLLRIQPGRCYSFHSDTEARFHLAVKTNDSAFIIYRDVPPYHIPADGIVYSMNATHKHTALNGDRTGQDRIHLVFNGLE